MAEGIPAGDTKGASARRLTADLQGEDMLHIGITGGVGAGKSAILKYLEENYNSRVMLADNIAHDLMEPGTACYGELQKLFAEDGIFQGNGRIDRPKMAQVLFADREKRAACDRIVHPAVWSWIREQDRRERARGALDLLVSEAALLQEEKEDAICEELWYIYTSEANRRLRLKANRGYSDEKIDRIFRSQADESEYRARCDAQIDNNESPEAAFRQIDRLLQARGIRKKERMEND